MVKQIIKEAIEKNPIGLKEAVETELMSRIQLALEAKKKSYKEEDDYEEEDETEEDEELEESVELDEKVNTGPEEAISIISNSIAMNPSVVKAALEAADLDPVAVVTALKGKKTIKAMQLGNLVMGHAFGGSISKKDLTPIKKATDAAFVGKKK